MVKYAFEVDAVLKRVTEGPARAPGAVAMVTDRERDIWQGAAGDRRLGDGAISLDTVFAIFSTTKAIVGTAALQCVEEGLLDLDAPAKNYAPAIDALQVLEGFDSAGQPKLRPPKSDITTRQLMLHTAGFGCDFFNETYKRLAEEHGQPSVVEWAVKNRLESRHNIVTPDRLPEWVPGKVLLFSDGQNWRNVGLRTYHDQGQDVIVPALSHYMLVSHRKAVTPMQRRFEAGWKTETLGRGATSLLTGAHWTWDEPLVVTHLYLAPGLLAGIASEPMDCHVAEGQLAAVLRTDEPVLTGMVKAIAAEARQAAMGGALFVESLSRALGVHLLRRYASIRLPTAQVGPRLSPVEMRRIDDDIEEHLA